jgi:hypothetical protein
MREMNRNSLNKSRWSMEKELGNRRGKGDGGEREREEKEARG